MGCWKRLHPAFYGLFYNPGKVVKVATVAYRVERAVHRTLREFDLGLCGEWFDVSVDDAKAAVLKCADLIGAKYADPIKVMSYGGALLAASWEAAGVQKKMASLIMRNLEAVHDGVEALRAEEAA